MKFDHVALAVGDHRKALAALTGDLGGLVISGGSPPRSGFRAMQVRVGRGAEGMTVELLEPAGVEHNDFLERFLAANGDGPHHMTFKTDDIERELGRLRGLGIHPVGIDFGSTFWQEMFIHPRDAHGTVIQIAQSDVAYPPMDEWLAGLPETLEIYDGSAWWDEDSIREPAGSPSTLLRVVIETPDRTAGDDFYRWVLGSDATTGDDHSDHRWSGGTVRLVDAGVARPRVSHLEVSGGYEGTIAGARFVGVGS